MYSERTECMEGESLCILELNAWKGILMYSGTECMEGDPYVFWHKYSVVG